MSSKQRQLTPQSSSKGEVGKSATRETIDGSSRKRSRRDLESQMLKQSDEMTRSAFGQGAQTPSSSNQALPVSVAGSLSLPPATRAALEAVLGQLNQNQTGNQEKKRESTWYGQQQEAQITSILDQFQQLQQLRPQQQLQQPLDNSSGYNISQPQGSLDRQILMMLLGQNKNQRGTSTSSSDAAGGRQQHAQDQQGRHPSSAPYNAHSQRISAQQLLANAMGNPQRQVIDGVDTKGQGATASRTTSVQRGNIHSNQNQISGIVSTLQEILHQHHEQQRQTLHHQQQKEIQMLQQIQKHPNQFQQFSQLLQLLLQSQQTNHDLSQNPQFLALQEQLQQQQSFRTSPPSTSVSSDESGSSNPLHQLTGARTMSSRDGHQQQLLLQQEQQQQLTNNAATANTRSQGNFQLPLLQMLLASQHGNAPQAASSNIVPAVPESHGQTVAVPAAMSTNSAAILQLLSRSWNQMHNGAIFVPTQGMNSLAQQANSSSQASAPMEAPGGSTTVVPPNLLSRAPSRIAARNQQRQLLGALRAFSANPVSENSSSSSSSGSILYEDLAYALPANVFDNRGPDGRALDLPVLLVMKNDHTNLSAYQTLLRYQIEVFRANEVDASTHQRGRNKPIRVGQVGFRCRHCKHQPIADRPRGSSYFPSEVEGVYQAAQNMNTTHFQSGVCTHMGEPLKRQFADLANTKATSTGAGRSYWAAQARMLGLENNAEEGGIRFWLDGISKHTY